MKAVCDICPRHCCIPEGGTGACRARKNENGRIVCSNYGMISSIALDPIEKKPLKRFRPGSMILSAGSCGCNLYCPFCQNHEISMASCDDIPSEYFSPADLCDAAVSMKSRGNIGVAYTYNEPLVSYEYIMDCSEEIKKAGLANVVVTNGYICKEPLERLLPDIDAMNIDLKGFTQKFYDMVGGDLETVKNTIVSAAGSCHVEVTFLVIPEENDSTEEISRLSSWLASLDRSIPLHVSRFFPRYKMSGRTATPAEKIYELADIAKKHLKYVYTGNC